MHPIGFYASLICMTYLVGFVDVLCGGEVYRAVAQQRRQMLHGRASLGKPTHNRRPRQLPSTYG